MRLIIEDRFRWGRTQ